MKRVTIIIPVYNAGPFLASCLNDLLHQTYPHIEIIIVDDSSTDNSYKIAKSFESEFVKVIQQVNSGAAVARNTGLAHATGNYIQFLDADDFLSYDKIERQVKALELNPGKLAVCNYVQFVFEQDRNDSSDLSYQDKFILSSDDPAGFLINLYTGNGQPNFIQTNSWLVPRSVIDKSGGWRNYRCPDDDGEFFARVVLASNGIIYVPGILNYYRISTNNQSLSRNSTSKYLQNVLLTIDLKYTNLKKHTNSPALNYFLALHYLEFAVYAFPKNKLLSAVAFRRYKRAGAKANLPLLGGKIIKVINIIFGWKFARWVKYHVVEKNK